MTGSCSVSHGGIVGHSGGVNLVHSAVAARETLEHRHEGDGAILRLGDRLRLWQNMSVYPIPFQIAAKDMDPETLGALRNGFIATSLAGSSMTSPQEFEPTVSKASSLLD